MREGDNIEDIGDDANNYQLHLRLQIWYVDGQLLMRSKNAPETPLTSTNGLTETGGFVGTHGRSRLTDLNAVK
jgi:two-component system, OmpR family, sensor histidine kinase QseC